MQVDAIYHGTAERAKCVPSSLGAHGNVELGSSKADSRQIGRKGQRESKRGRGRGHRDCLVLLGNYFALCQILNLQLFTSHACCEFARVCPAWQRERENMGKGEGELPLAEISLTC